MRNRPQDVPPLDLIERFEAVARNLGFARAGTELNLTQSAVSRQIKALEVWLDVTLFERRPRVLVLTRHGETSTRQCRVSCAQSRTSPARSAMTNRYAH